MYREMLEDENLAADTRRQFLAKMKKQMSYANSKSIPFVAIAGETEMNEGKVTLKNMTTGEQALVTADELISAVKGE